MPDMREEFEAWVSGRKVCTRYGAKLNTNPDGMYSDYRINDRWLAWKASRAALRVELPDDGIEDCQRDWQNSCRDNFDTGYCYATDRITQALQQAGIEVKENG
ncbi:TPA: hypothetical protein ACRNLW_004982 [Pseudomonas aeruginosa]|uniref:hypothetical protein n=1 Tax=Pseudomonas TaxID=286 RepID=UPI0003B9A4C8|nr:hypothetical protein [Pseudomonas aeruginosa]HCL3090193.1 hypothetical protein [Pseudomonas aeruginosa 1BAE]EKU5532971.1 hypothetical protein [Pseudomonas aeruginosa]EKW5992869.1 hypothetical protein [Pseudomonas aeruginosa]EMB6065633.1 hypothetical protein [Pseudomonas aeruginosa]ERU37737.1 hypothetical protein Q092_03006 [Pseudomonas aeruginosa CF77]